MMRKGLLLLAVILCSTSVYTQTPENEFKPSGKILSQVFGDYFYVLTADTGIGKLSKTFLNKPSGMTGFQFKRVTLGYEYNWTPQITTFIKIETNDNALSADNTMSFFLKDAYLKYKINAFTEFCLGIQPTFSFETSEQYWGLRYVEKTILDLRSIEPARDFGISVRGKFSAGSPFSYIVMAGDNSYVRPETDKYKKLYGKLGYSPFNGLDFCYYSDYAFLAEKNGKPSNELVQAVFAGYKNEKISVGLETFLKTTGNGYMTPDSMFTNLNGMGISVFGSVNISKKIACFARYDFYDPNINAGSTNDRRYFATAGLSWTPVANINFSPNLEMETYESAKYSPSPSVWARLNFQWNLK